MRKERVGHGVHEYEHGAGKWATRALYAGAAIGAIFGINKAWPYIRLIPTNLEGVGVGIAGLCAASLLFDTVRKERAGKVVAGLGIMAGLTIVNLAENQGYPGDNGSEKETTTLPGNTTTVPQTSSSSPETGKTVKGTKYVFEYSDPRCQDLDPVRLDAGGTVGKLIKSKTLNENGQQVFTQPDIDKIVTGQDFDSHPGMSLDNVKAGWVIDINCASKKATSTTAAFVTSSSVEMAWNPMASAEFAAVA